MDSHRSFPLGALALGLFSVPALAGSDPDGACDPAEAALDRCFVSPGGFVVEVVPGPNGEFPVIDGNGDSVFAYLVTGPGANGGSCAGVHDVSHASFLLPECSDSPFVVVSSTSGGELLRDGDPSCGFGSGDPDHDVWKWDVETECDGARLYSITLQGIVPAAPTAFLLKAAQDCDVATILGPDCADVTCEGSIGDFVWLDLDGDGIQEDGEAGIAGVTLVLTNSMGTAVGSTQTGPDGGYVFGSLCPGDYTVSVDVATLPEGVEPSPCEASPNSDMDSNCNPSSTTVTVGQPHVQDVDFGYVPVPFVYCESNPNSTGESAGLSYEGNPSISENDFSLFATGMPPGQPGYFFYGTQQVEIPFGNGYRCIGGTVVRYRKIAIQATGGAEVHFDFTLHPLDDVVPGVPYYFQLWYRDPQSPPAFFNTTDAMCVIFAP